MKYYKSCSFKVICKNNVAINRITVQHKKVFVIANFDRPYTIVSLKESILQISRGATVCCKNYINHKVV